MDKKLLIVILVTLICALSFGRSFLGLIGAIPWHYGYSDIFNEDRINPEAAKKIPYLESPIEYPVITGFFIYAMWHLGRNLLGYAALTGVFLTLFAVITATILYRLCDESNTDKKRIYMFFIFAPSLVIFGIYNWDIIAVMLTALAIYSFYKSKYAWSALFLALGFSAKLFPIVLLPIMLLKTGIKNAVKMVIVFLAVFFILNGYFIANSFDVWKATYGFHAARGANIDSVWSLSSLSASTINIVSLILFLASYFILVYNHKKYDLITLGFASVLLFLIFNKIFSPQYILWLLPFFVLSQNTSKKTFYFLEAANMVVFFSTMLWLLASKEQVFLAISNISTIARSIILAYLVFEVLRPKSLYIT